MLKITCPTCGMEADETEFQAGGEAHLTRPASTDPENIGEETFRDYLYLRKNPRGVAHELWLCARGCGKWFHAARDTYSQDIKHTYKLSERPPGEKPRTSRPGTPRPSTPRKRKTAPRTKKATS